MSLIRLTVILFDSVYINKEQGHFGYTTRVQSVAYQYPHYTSEIRNKVFLITMDA